MREYYQTNKFRWNNRRREKQPEINARKRDRYRDDPEYRKAIINKVNEYRKNNLDKVASTKMKAIYGIDMDEKNRLLKLQKGLCAICGIEPEKYRRGGGAHVDHDHKTKKVRGLLCSSCNHGLGKFKDSPELLRKAIVYLEKHHA